MRLCTMLFSTPMHYAYALYASRLRFTLLLSVHMRKRSRSPLRVRLHLRLPLALEQAPAQAQAQQVKRSKSMLARTSMCRHSFTRPRVACTL